MPAARVDEVRARAAAAAVEPGGSDSSPAPWNGRRLARRPTVGRAVKPGEPGVDVARGRSSFDPAANEREPPSARGTRPVRAPARRRGSTLRSERSLVFVQRDAAQAREALRAAVTGCSPDASASSRSRWRLASSASPAIASARSGTRRIRIIGQLGQDLESPAGRLWHKLRTASIRTDSLVSLSGTAASGRASATGGQAGASSGRAARRARGVRGSFKRAAM